MLVHALILPVAPSRVGSTRRTTAGASVTARIRAPGKMAGMTLVLPIDPEANRLLEHSPLALLIGMTLDQHMC
ncbi:hypothetical protein [Micromonospora sp. DT63]|uniref:hypothetical protein n=1 Tax=Micromonospora sp. DT63 TaxID=3393441 RepID=UPI003CF0BC39